MKLTNDLKNRLFKESDHVIEYANNKYMLLKSLSSWYVREISEEEVLELVKNEESVVIFK